MFRRFKHLTKWPNVRWCFLLVAVPVVPTDAAGPIDDPISKSELSVTLELYAELPKTGNSPNARLNVLREEPSGSERLFVNDLNGLLYSVDRATREASTYLDLTSAFPHLKTSPGLASGFVSFDFHPEFAANGKFYTVHSEVINADNETDMLAPPVGNVVQANVVTEWTASTPSAPAFQGSRRELMRLGALGPFHPIGDVTFNPAASVGDPDYGMLYISIGDGQSFNLNHTGNLQRPDSYLGSILRIDPSPGGQPIAGQQNTYSVPASNPWAGDDDETTFGEVFANGFRNPHRLAFDADTGTLLTTDIGERHLEEVNVVHGGGNYGWPLREGSFSLGGAALPENDRELGLEYPVAQYDHDEGRAITNGVVYRGDQLPQLDGMFVFGDIVNGRIFYSDLAEMLAADDDVPETTAEIRELQLVFEDKESDFIDVLSQSAGSTLSRTDLRIGGDNSGGLYFMSKQTGEIYLASMPLALDCNSDGVVDENDLACSCALGTGPQGTLFDQLGTLQGDLDGDGEVAFGDFIILANHFASAQASYVEGDLDCNGSVEFGDFLILASQFGNAAIASRVVPEPGGFISFVSVVSFGMLRRRRLQIPRADTLV